MSRLLDLLDVAPVGEDVWQGRASGPEGKRAYGGQLVAQSLAAAARTVEAAMVVPPAPVFVTVTVPAVLLATRTML